MYESRTWCHPTHVKTSSGYVFGRTPEVFGNTDDRKHKLCTEMSFKFTVSRTQALGFTTASESRNASKDMCQPCHPIHRCSNFILMRCPDKVSFLCSSEMFEQTVQKHKPHEGSILNQSAMFYKTTVNLIHRFTLLPINNDIRNHRPGAFKEFVRI